MTIYTGTAVVVAAVAVLTLYLTFILPKRKDQRRFNEAILGYPSSPGVPAQMSVLQKLDAIGEHLETQDKALDHILHEIPPNGVPFRSDVDAIRTQLVVVETNLSHLNDDLRALEKRIP